VAARLTRRALVTTGPATLVAALGGEIPVTAAGLQVEGDPAAVVALVARVRRPEKDPAGA
jgi:hypothetical protein